MEGERAVINNIRMVATEFKDVADEELIKWTEALAPLVSKKKFGKMYDMALALFVCHKMKLAGMGDTSMGTIADSLRLGSYSEGSVSVSFTNSMGGSATATDAEYALTPYGVQYLTLRKALVMTITID